MPLTSTDGQQQPRVVLDIRDLSIEFPTFDGPVKAVRGVSIFLREGQIIGVVGESGSGKSVTAMAVGRLLPEGAHEITGGSVQVLGRNVGEMTQKELLQLRGRDVAFIFQEPANALNPTTRIGRQMTRVIREHLRIENAAAMEIAESLLRDMQIAGPAMVMGAYPFELSGGMQQRVLVAMAFSCNPKIIIADEPTTALDVTVQAQVLALLQAKVEQTGAAVMLISHDLAVVAHLCERIYVMYAGRVVESGSSQQITHDPRHPYTQALLAALPEAGEPKADLVTTPGSGHGFTGSMEGCAFRDRCREAGDDCLRQPPLTENDAGSGRHVACWRRT